MRRLAALSLAVLLVGAILFACGPDLAPWILGGDRNVLQGPIAFYYEEVRKLAPAGTGFHEPGDNYAAANRTASTRAWAAAAPRSRARPGAPRRRAPSPPR